MAEKKIDGVEYRVDLVTAKEAYTLLSELIRLAGPGARHLPTIMSLALEEGEQSKYLTDVAAFAAAAEMLTANGTAAFVDFKAQILALAKIKRPSGAYDQVDLDSDFVGDLVQAEKVFNYVIEVQFGPFLHGSEGSGPAKLAMILIRHVFPIKK